MTLFFLVLTLVLLLALALFNMFASKSKNKFKKILIGLGIYVLYAFLSIICRALCDNEIVYILLNTIIFILSICIFSKIIKVSILEEDGMCVYGAYSFCYFFVQKVITYLPAIFLLLSSDGSNEYELSVQQQIESIISIDPSLLLVQMVKLLIMFLILRTLFVRALVLNDKTTYIESFILYFGVNIVLSLIDDLALQCLILIAIFILMIVYFKKRMSKVNVQNCYDRKIYKK